MPESWVVYILTNYTNRVLYTGITNDLARRLEEHRSRQDPFSFTTRYRVYKLIWYQEFDSPEEAILIEKKIKGWKRSKKLALIQTSNPHFQDLATLR